MACRLLNFRVSKLLPFKKVIRNKEVALYSGYFLTQERSFRGNFGRFLKTMKHRREIAGPERQRRRSEWDNWHYKAELFAFSKRLNEDISEDTLRWAFVHESFIEREEQKRQELDIPSQNIQLDLKSNASLITLGEEVTSNYLKRYLTHCFPKLPFEGIRAVHDYLMSTEVLSHVSSHIGTADLIFSAEYPPQDSTLSDSLKAIIGSIVTDSSASQAENFVLDFVCPQLIGKDVFEIWDLKNPFSVLSEILQRHGLGECEPLLIFESGCNTIEAIYHVGLYLNEEYLGRGPGETLDIAVEMAAYDVLRRLFGLQDSSRPMYFGERARSLDLSSFKMPLVVHEWTSESLAKNSEV